MKNRLVTWAALFAAGVVVVSPGAMAQPGSVYKAPRTPDGKPDLQGVWEARSTAAAGLEAHGASLGIRAGASVIVDPADGKIPYLPAALAKRDDNFKNRAAKDPLNKCFLPGVPRIMYLPYPFEIFQTPNYIAVASEFAHSTRTFYMKGEHYADGEFWMGDSRAKWEGETLVVDAADFNADTWLDMSGDFHSEKLHVVEHFTRTSPDTIQYEATLDDPNVYSRPWTIRMPLYRHTEPNAQIFEYECHVYLEDEKKPK
jgi:hypothetical protein